jgi:hypothetical protein
MSIAIDDEVIVIHFPTVIKKQYCRAYITFVEVQGVMTIADALIVDPEFGGFALRTGIIKTVQNDSFSVELETDVHQIMFKMYPRMRRRHIAWCKDIYDALTSTPGHGHTCIRDAAIMLLAEILNRTN